MFLDTLWTGGVAVASVLLGEPAHVRVVNAAIAAAVALALLPASLLVTTSVDSWVGLLDPQTSFRVIAAIGLPYLRVVPLSLALVIGGVFASVAISWSRLRQVPVIGGLIEHTLLLVPWTT